VTLALRDSAVAASTVPLAPNDVVIVTGGARGVTADCARALAQASGATLVLLGRSPAPADEPEWLAPAADEAGVKRVLLERAPQGNRPSPKQLAESSRQVLAARDIRATLASIAVKNRAHAVANPLAQFREPITIDQVLNARPIVEPLGLLEVPGRADGAVALMIVSEDMARASGRPYALVRGRGFEHEGLHQVSDRPGDSLSYGSLRAAGSRALESAGVTLADIGSFQVYSPCTIVEALGTESLGMFARGQGADAAAAGETRFDGRYPVNTCGGCLSRGHPPEVTPLYDVVEAVTQLHGRAQGRQVARRGLAMTVCELGNYNAALVHILEGRA
jgi:acetyl-CoA acetyltransferase